MKATEYFQKYLELNATNTEVESLAHIMICFINEIKELIALRNAQTDAALLGIIKELDQKWESFVRMVNEKTKISVRSGAFKELLVEEYLILFPLFLSPDKRVSGPTETRRMH